MATTELLSAGTAAAASGEFTLASGETATLFLKDAAGPRVPVDCVVKVQIKAASGEFFDVGQLDVRAPAQLVQAPGTYRVVRPESAASVGVDKA